MGNCASSRSKQAKFNDPKDDLLLAEAAIKLGKEELAAVNLELSLCQRGLQAKGAEVSALRNDLMRPRKMNASLTLDKANQQA